MKKDCVYVDESGIDAFLSRKRGRAPRGEKVVGEVSGRRFARQSFVAAKCERRILSPMTFDGTCNTALFEAWIEKILLPELKPGQTVIMDNAAFHKSAKTRELIENAGCTLLFLPPYSPDLNPIEKFWAWFKQKVQEILPSQTSLQNAVDHVFKTYGN